MQQAKAAGKEAGKDAKPASRNMLALGNYIHEKNKKDFEAMIKAASKGAEMRQEIGFIKLAEVKESKNTEVPPEGNNAGEQNDGLQAPPIDTQQSKKEEEPHTFLSDGTNLS